MKQIICVFVIIGAIVSIIYGALLPYKKAKMYVDVVRASQAVGSLENFKQLYERMFNFYSPVGQPEVVKFASNDFMNVISSLKDQEDIARELVKFIEPRLSSDDVRNLLVGAQMHSVLLERSRKQEDYIAAVKYYQRILEIGPRLPHALYGLLSLYSMGGDKEGAKKVSNTILGYWPNDTQVRSLFEK